MEGSYHATFKQRKCGFHGIRVHDPANILALAVANAVMLSGVLKNYVRCVGVIGHDIFDFGSIQIRSNNAFPSFRSPGRWLGCSALARHVDVSP